MPSTKVQLYLAAPLFSIAEREYNMHLASALERFSSSYSVLLPQQKAAEISGTPDFAQRMFTYCIKTLDASDCVIAILDGADADAGTSVEIGRAASTGKPIIGIRTDLRESEDRGLNLMVSCSCTHLIREPGLSVEELAGSVHGILLKIFS